MGVSLSQKRRLLRFSNDMPKVVSGSSAVNLKNKNKNSSFKGCTAAGLLPLLGRPPGTVFRTSDPVRNPNFTETAFRRLLQTFLFARYQRTRRIRVGVSCW